MEEVPGLGLPSFGIDTGGGGLSNSSGVSGDDKQSFGGSSFGGISLGDFGSKTTVAGVPSWVWVVAVVLVVFLLMKRGF